MIDDGGDVLGFGAEVVGCHHDSADAVHPAPPERSPGVEVRVVLDSVTHVRVERGVGLEPREGGSGAVLDGGVVDEELHGGFRGAFFDGFPVVAPVNVFGLAAGEVGDVEVRVGALADAVFGGAAGVVGVRVEGVTSFKFNNEVGGVVEEVHAKPKGDRMARVRVRVRMVGVPSRRKPPGKVALPHNGLFVAARLVLALRANRQQVVLRWIGTLGSRRILVARRVGC